MTWDRRVLETLQPASPRDGAVAVWPAVPAECVDYVFVGEAPGKEEVRQGLPFVGRSGQLLRGVAGDVGITPAHFTNASLFRPPTRGSKDSPPVAQQVKKERQRLWLEIVALNPKAVIALGATAAYALCGDKPRARGMVRYFEYLGRSIPIYITHHPARILYEPDTYKDFYEDLQRAKNLVLSERYTGIETHPDPWAGDIPFQSDLLSIDTEYVGHNAATATLRCIAVYDGESATVYTPETLDELRRALRGYSGRIVGHNAGGDEIILRRYGLRVRFTDDTILRHYSQDERKGSHGLKVLGPSVAGVETAIDLVWPYTHTGGEKPRDDDTRTSGWATIPDATLQSYCSQDALVTRRLDERLHDLADDRSGRLYEFLMRGYRAFVEGMVRGVRINRALLQEELAQQESKAEALRKEFDFNPESHDDTLEALRAAGFQVSNTQRGTLESLGAAELPRRLLAYRKESKLLKGFLRPLGGWTDEKGNIHEGWLDENDAVHTVYKLYGTDSGRTSSADPNIQQIPDRLKHLFQAREGHVFVGWDYNVHEVRGIAYYTHDAALCRLLRQRVDPHAYVASEVGLDRKQGKRSVFAGAYGASEDKLVEVGIPRDKAHKALETIRSLFPALDPWREEVHRLVWDQGWLETPYGRRRNFYYLDGIARFKAERIGVNFLVQSLCHDICFDGAIRAFELLGWPPLIYVHDFNAIEVREDEAEDAARRCEEIAGSVFPNEYVDWVPQMKIGTTWGDMHAPEEEETGEEDADEETS